MITHLEPDILEWEVKWASESITMNKASGGDGIPVELFQILKDDAVKVLHSICQQVWKTQPVATGLEKVSFPSNPKERQCQRMLKFSSVQFSCSVLFDSLQAHGIAAHQPSLFITNSQTSLRVMSIKSVMPSSHLILCRPLLLLPPIPPSIRVFSSESTLHMR